MESRIKKLIMGNKKGYLDIWTIVIIFVILMVLIMYLILKK